jgi:hypothetical protein
LPIGALVVDFALTIAISIAAAGSAVIAYVSALAPARIPIALGLVVFVAVLTWFGHAGRMIFAVMTCLFIIAAVAVLAVGWVSPHATHGHAPITGSTSPAVIAVLLAFPVAMALATGTEAPATSIAQLGQLEDRGRWRFGRGTLALTIVIVGALTLGLTALAVHLHVGIPRSDSTQIADLARTATGNGGLYAFFQLSSSLLLLAAASSSFQAGPGLLKALARTSPSGAAGLLPGRLARTNRHHTPVEAVVVYAVISAAIILAAGGHEQELVLVYAVAVFVSFLAGLLAMARFSRQRGSRLLTATNLLGAAAVAFTLIVNLARGYPLIAIAGTILIAAGLYWRWIRAGRPAGLEQIERHAEPTTNQHHHAKPSRSRRPAEPKPPARSCNGTRNVPLGPVVRRRSARSRPPLTPRQASRRHQPGFRQARVLGPPLSLVVTAPSRAERRSESGSAG